MTPSSGSGWPSSASLDSLTGVRLLSRVEVRVSARRSACDLMFSLDDELYVVDWMGFRAVDDVGVRSSLGPGVGRGPGRVVSVARRGDHALGDRARDASLARQDGGVYDQVYAVDEETGLVVLAIGSGPCRTIGRPGVVGSGSGDHRVEPGATVRVAQRFSGDVYPGRILLDDSGRWVVENVWCGRRAQLVSPVPGQVFDGRAPFLNLWMDLVPVGSDFEIEARNVGSDSAVLRAALYYSLVTHSVEDNLQMSWWAEYYGDGVVDPWPRTAALGHGE